MDAMHKEIQTLFIDEVYEVFYTLFNDGKNEGIYYYPQIRTSEVDDVYNEKKDKVYSNPVLLISRVQLNMVQDDEDIKVSRGHAIMTVPLKSFIENGIDVSISNYPLLRQGIIRYEDTWFTIEEVNPHAFVEQVFLLYNLECRQMQYTDLEENSFYYTDESDELVEITAEDLREDGYSNSFYTA